MQPELNHFLSFFIQAALLSICFPGYFCQNSQEYATCIKPFQCGGLRNLSYPFWGGSRPTYCGFPGFMLDCNGDVPLLNISSLSYRVLDINFSTYTLKVARQDLWNSTCPEVLYNTILDPDIFEIPSDSSDINVILYYNCTNNRRQQSRLPNQFNCDVNGATTMNVFNAGNASSGPGTNITCRNKISVPVNPTAARALANPNSSSISVLRAALANGFSIHWSADNSNCQSCQGSGGTCVYNLDSGWAPPGAFRPGDNRSYPVMPPDLAPVPAPELSSPGSSGQVGIIIGVTLGIVGMIIFTIVIVCYLKRRGSPGSPRQASKPGSPKQANKHSIEKFLLQHGSLAPKRYKYSEIKKITKSFSDKLGQGGYGSVYKGMLPDGSLVAVKVLTETDSNGEEFVNEVASISRTSHVNIVNLLGFCYDRNKRALVYEYMPNRSLDKFISTTGSRNVDCHLDLHQLYKIAVGVAKGLEYLHTGCNTRIVHFDIKPQNILLDEDFCPKISDFGLAKLSKKKQSVLSLLGARGTIGYIAPEIFSRNFGSVSHKSDVYSYGMMVLEMAGANKIVETEAIQSSDNSFAGRLYELVADDATRKLDDFVVGEDEETARKMFLVGFWCIQTNPSDRPSMSQVVEMLDGSLQLIQIPPKPVLFTPTLPDPKFSPSLSVYADIENSAEVVVDG